MFNKIKFSSLVFFFNVLSTCSFVLRAFQIPYIYYTNRVWLFYWCWKFALFEAAFQNSMYIFCRTTKSNMKKLLFLKLLEPSGDMLSYIVRTVNNHHRSGAFKGFIDKYHTDHWLTRGVKLECRRRVPVGKINLPVLLPSYFNFEEKIDETGPIVTLVGGVVWKTTLANFWRVVSILR